MMKFCKQGFLKITRCMVLVVSIYGTRHTALLTQWDRSYVPFILFVLASWAGVLSFAGMRIGLDDSVTRWLFSETMKKSSVGAQLVSMKWNLSLLLADVIDVASIDVRGERDLDHISDPPLWNQPTYAPTTNERKGPPAHGCIATGQPPAANAPKREMIKELNRSATKWLS